VFYYFAPGGVQSIAISVSECLSVRLSTRSLAQMEKHVQTSQNVLYMVRAAVALSSSDDNEICYVLPVLWMTSFSQMID